MHLNGEANHEDITMSAAAPPYDRAAELHVLNASMPPSPVSTDSSILARCTTHVPRICHIPDTEGPLHGQESSSAATVLVIDLGGGDRAAVVDAVRRGTAEWGFFHVTGHGVPNEAMRAAVAAVRAFHEADGGDGSDKARLYSREPGKVVKYYYNFDLFQ
ncbi:unnamed protein product [Miscanthus lutarioriparius]|uniref:Non-haem dioxygenase N-terminal domain-containing protein n=1 Tax=Miscanthus lutarioriparius TaxID=422564 RepID=A0A811QWF1_9POAL|nr:unnamed protein product [Miscanthus lutarioriparius]